MSMIYISNLTFSYDGGWEKIFDNVSFRIDTDWRLGFTGRNGRGKTTFLKLLTGQLEYSGTIVSSQHFEYFPYTVANRSEETYKVLEGIIPQAQDWQILRELNLLDVDGGVLYQKFDTLSYGEQTKILLVALFLKENGFLLIDEPTNHLDTPGRKKVSDYLKSKKGFILVSHDRTFLNNCVDHMLVINRADIEVVKGNFESWQQNKELQDSFELAENDKLKKSISRLEEAAKRAGEWADKTESTKIGTRIAGLRPDRGAIGHKAAKMMKRAKSFEQRQLNAVEEKTKLLKNIEKDEALSITPVKFIGERLLELKDVRISYGEKEVCSGITFCIRNGDRVALSGKNGCGKSSILSLIYGKPLSYGGTLNKGGGLKISSVHQNSEKLYGSLREYAREYGIEDSLFMTILSKLDFNKEQFGKNIQDFSEGQKKKIMIARSLCEKAHLYVWDEPLNFIDVISRMQIERLIVKYRPTLLFTEHDAAFVENVATEIIRI